MVLSTSMYLRAGGEGICSIRTPSCDGIYGIREVGGDSICSIRTEGDDDICSIRTEGDDDICSIRTEGGDVNYALLRWWRMGTSSSRDDSWSPYSRLPTTVVSSTTQVQCCPSTKICCANSMSLRYVRVCLLAE
jgi:hypothetical protein